MARSRAGWVPRSARGLTIRSISDAQGRRKAGVGRRRRAFPTRTLTPAVALREPLSERGHDPACRPGEARPDGFRHGRKLGGGSALTAHMGAMATIQIRNVPEAVHSVYQMWAAAAGMSVQIRNTSWPSSYTTPPSGRLPN